MANDSRIDSRIDSRNSKIYLKSLSGDIIPISIASILQNKEYSIWDTWSRISSIIASENDCEDQQVVIFGDNDDDNNPPPLVLEAQYNFFIRDKNYYKDNFTVTMICHTPYEIDNNYRKYSISIRENNKLRENNNFDILSNFDVYEDDLGSFFHQKNVVYDFDKIKTTCLGFSLYTVLWEDVFNIPWYNKIEIINRIMTQYDNIENYRFHDTFHDIHH
jgi:hypothetical protein